MRVLLPLLCLALAACGPTTLAGPCQVTCDCPVMNAPIRCPGEWVCNAQQRCEYQCPDVCGGGADAGCTTGKTCNGTICSERATCR